MNYRNYILFWKWRDVALIVQSGQIPGKFRYYMQRSPAQCTRLVPLGEIRILRDLLYSPYAQTCKDFFLAEIVYEAVRRFDDANRAEAAVAYHKDYEA